MPIFDSVDSCHFSSFVEDHYDFGSNMNFDLSTLEQFQFEKYDFFFWWFLNTIPWVNIKINDGRH